MNFNLSVVNEIINEMRVAKGLPKIDDFYESHDLRNDFGFDSFDLAELTVRIEDAIGVDIFEEGIIYTLGQIYLLLDAK